MQRNWDSGKVIFICRNGNFTATNARKWGVHFRELSLWNLLKSIDQNTTRIVFHAQASLPYLIISLLLIRLKKWKVELVYDIHDMHEQQHGSIKVWVRWLILGAAELLVLCLFKIRAITVSESIAKEIARRYKCAQPDVCLNVSPNQKSPESHKLLSEPRIVYFGNFGRFHEYRISSQTLETLEREKVSIDFHGHIDPEYQNKLAGYAERGVIRLHGEYRPEDLSFLYNYNFAILDYASSPSCNVRFCLPNKIFQALGHGLTVLVSPNLEQARQLFAKVPFAVVQLPPNYKKVREFLENIIRERPSEYYDMVNGYLDKLADMSRLSYLGLHRDEIQKHRFSS